MDVSMPELDGFELADMIRQHPRFHENRHYFYFRRAPDRRRSHKGLLERGAVDYISVPVIPEVLPRESQRFRRASLPRAKQLEVLNGELRRLSTSLISTQDDERRRIARELHDGLGQDW